MLRITGYSDKYSVCPGDNIQFYINSEDSEVYETQIVRLIHGDTNPEGPGYKEEEIQAECNKNYPVDTRKKRYRLNATKTTQGKIKEYMVVHMSLFLKMRDWM